MGPVGLLRSQPLRAPGLENSGYGAQVSGSNGEYHQRGKRLPAWGSPTQPHPGKGQKHLEAPPPPWAHLSPNQLVPSLCTTGQRSAPAQPAPQHPSLPSRELAWQGWEAKPIAPNSVAERWGSHHLSPAGVACDQDQRGKFVRPPTWLALAHTLGYPGVP